MAEAAFGLSASALEAIRAVFADYPQIQAVRIFGSRAKGNFRSNSDIDLAYWGALSDRQHNALHQALEALPLPYRFDLLAYAQIDDAPLREHIDRVGKTLS